MSIYNNDDFYEYKSKLYNKIDINIENKIKCYNDVNNNNVLSFIKKQIITTINDNLNNIVRKFLGLEQSLDFENLSL